MVVNISNVKRSDLYKTTKLYYKFFNLILSNQCILPLSNQCILPFHNLLIKDLFC